MAKILEVSEHEKMVYLCGFYTGKARNEGDEMLARVYAEVALDMEWALCIEREKETEAEQTQKTRTEAENEHAV